jgi:hypothetical protein
MPYRPRKVHQRPRRTLTALNVYELCTSHCFFHGAELPEADLPQAWASVRQALLTLYAQRVPGCRPWAWWLLEAPEPRQCLDGQHDCPARDQYMARFHQNCLYYGRPGLYACPQCWEEGYESQTRFLQRTRLLTPHEEALIPQAPQACDAWWVQQYGAAEAHPHPWAPGGALAACQAFLTTQGT